MKDNKIESLQPTPSKSERFMINLLQNKKRLSAIFLSFIVFGLIAGLSYYIWDKTKTKSYEASSNAPALVTLNHSKANLKKFSKIASRYPSMQSQLDGPLAQEYLNLGDHKTSKTIWARIQKRQNSLMTKVKEFNEVTFLIEEHQYKEALSQGYQLKENLKADPNLKNLYVAHLIRLISIEEKQGHLDQKKALLSELFSLNLDEDQELNEILQLGNLNVAEYIGGKEYL